MPSPEQPTQCPWNYHHVLNEISTWVTNLIIFVCLLYVQLSSLEITPAPTVLPPSRSANRCPEFEARNHKLEDVQVLKTALNKKITVLSKPYQWILLFLALDKVNLDPGENIIQDLFPKRLISKVPRRATKVGVWCLFEGLFYLELVKGSCQSLMKHSETPWTSSFNPKNWEVGI